MLDIIVARYMPQVGKLSSNLNALRRLKQESMLMHVWHDKLVNAISGGLGGTWGLNHPQLVKLAHSSAQCACLTALSIQGKVEGDFVSSLSPV